MANWLKRLGRQAGWFAAALVVSASLTAVPAGAQVPQQYAAELARKLVVAEQFLKDNGFSRAAGPFAGGLEQRRSAQFDVTLRAGLDYRIVGVCDSRCTDLDLKLYDPSGNEVAEDVLQDSVPVLQIRPVSTGSYAIDVDMARCGGPACWYAFNVYSR